MDCQREQTRLTHSEARHVQKDGVPEVEGERQVAVDIRLIANRPVRVSPDVQISIR